ncbi:MAG: flagellar biosynthetic protein FliO [Puniceicoccales bacterium]|nr:flagellar biosynthetic protein FliO [Puniceicoccales bacterium]
MKDSDFDRLHITGRLSMGGRHYIAVVQCNGQKFLVGISPSAVTSLGELMPSPPGKGSVSRKGEATCQNRGELLAKEVDSLAQKLVSQGSGYFQRH